MKNYQKDKKEKKSINKRLSFKSPILAHIIVFSKYYYIWDKKWIFYDQVRALKSAALKHTFEFLLNVCLFRDVTSTRLPEINKFKQSGAKAKVIFQSGVDKQKISWL